jgi:hypothetical protein
VQCLSSEAMRCDAWADLKKQFQENTILLKTWGDFTPDAGKADAKQSTGYY